MGEVYYSKEKLKYWLCTILRTFKRKLNLIWVMIMKTKLVLYTHKTIGYLHNTSALPTSGTPRTKDRTGDRVQISGSNPRSETHIQKPLRTCDEWRTKSCEPKSGMQMTEMRPEHSVDCYRGTTKWRHLVHILDTSHIQKNKPGYLVKIFHRIKSQQRK